MMMMMIVGRVRRPGAVAVHRQGDVDGDRPVTGTTPSLRVFPSGPAQLQLPETAHADQRRVRVAAIPFPQRPAGSRSGRTDFRQKRHRLLPRHCKHGRHCRTVVTVNVRPFRRRYSTRACPAFFIGGQDRRREQGWASLAGAATLLPTSWGSG